MKPLLLTLLLLCGCSSVVEGRRTKDEWPQPPAQNVRRSVDVAPALKILRWGWQSGHGEEGIDANGNIISAVLPKWSGLESTPDFVHWFAETNLPVTGYLQEFVVALPANEQYRFYRAVDRYQ